MTAWAITFTFDIVSTRRYFKIARERVAIIWNNYPNNERLLIIKHGINLYCSTEMITTSKLTAPKNKVAPATCVVGHSIIPIYAMPFLDLKCDLRVINRRTLFSTRTLATREVSWTHTRSYRYSEVEPFRLFATDRLAESHTAPFLLRLRPTHTYSRTYVIT